MIYMHVMCFEKKCVVFSSFPKKKKKKNISIFLFFKKKKKKNAFCNASPERRAFHGRLVWSSVSNSRCFNKDNKDKKVKPPRPRPRRPKTTNKSANSSTSTTSCIIPCGAPLKLSK